MLQHTHAYTEVPTPQNNSPLAKLWNRGDGWRIALLAFLAYIIANIIVAAVVIIANDGELGLGGTIANFFAIATALVGSVLVVNRFRPKHTLTTLGFKPTTRNWLLIAAAIGVVAPARGLLLQPLAERYPALNAGVDLLEQMLVFDDPVYMVIVAAFGVLFVPIYEEFFFRAFVQNILHGKWGRWVGIIGSGLAFGLFHIIPLQAISAVPLGIAAAWLYERTNSLWPAIVLHVVNNLLTFAMIPFLA